MADSSALAAAKKLLPLAPAQREALLSKPPYAGTGLMASFGRSVRAELAKLLAQQAQTVVLTGGLAPDVPSPAVPNVSPTGGVTGPLGPMPVSLPAPVAGTGTVVPVTLVTSHVDSLPAVDVGGDGYGVETDADADAGTGAVLPLVALAAVAAGMVLFGGTGRR